MTRVNTEAGWTAVNGPSLSADEASAEFFEAARADTLLLKWCGSCEGWSGPATDYCAHCHGDDLSWRAAAGTGKLVTWTVVHSPPHPAFAVDMPIASTIVELIEGPWISLRLVGQRTGLRVGAKVKVRFAHSDDGASYPVATLKLTEEGT